MCLSAFVSAQRTRDMERHKLPIIIINKLTKFNKSQVQTSDLLFLSHSLPSVSRPPLLFLSFFLSFFLKRKTRHACKAIRSNLTARVCSVAEGQPNLLRNNSCSQRLSVFLRLPSCQVCLSVVISSYNLPHGLALDFA